MRSIVRASDNIVRYSDAMFKMPGAVQEGTAISKERQARMTPLPITGALSVQVKNRLHSSAPIDAQLPPGPPRRAVWWTIRPPPLPTAFAVCRLSRGNRFLPVLAVCRLPRGNRLPAAPARTAVASAHVGLDVRIERIEPIEARGRRRRTASVCSAGHGAPATDPPSRAPWSGISATRTASRPNGEIWTSRVLRGLSMPQINHYCASKASLRGDSRQIHAGIAHRMVGAIRGCSVTTPAPDPKIASLLPVIENTYESRVVRDV